jgi:non-specific serine/threonine protein kinase
MAVLNAADLAGLDNCEHVIEGCARAVTALLRSCENLSILATSREPLGVPGEVLYQVAPLLVPREDEPLEAVVAADAVQLLAARIQAVQPDFELSASTAPLVRRICHLVDGLPLGIELAASCTSSMSLTEIAHRLSRPLSLLTVGPRSAPVRQQPLRATIDWSYSLLTIAERALLRRLAVFTGGFTREAVEALCTPSERGPHARLDLLDRLVNHSLVIADSRGEVTRFSLLETVRQYCQENWTKPAVFSGFAQGIATGASRS